MATTYDLSPRDVALYQRSNEYLSRLNALDPYSREYANVYNDYVDTIDQLSNRDFRASLGSTLLEFAPMTRPKVQARAPEPVQQPRASEPIQLASADNILYRSRPTNQQPAVSSGYPEYTPKELATRFVGSQEDSSQPRMSLRELVAGYQSNMDTPSEVIPYGIAVHSPYWEAYPYTMAESQTQEVVPYGITVSSPDWKAYPYTSAEPQSPVIPYGVYSAMGPVLQTAKENAQRSSSKGQAKSQSSSTTSKRTPVPYGRYGAMTPVLETARINAQEQVEPEGTDFPQAIDLPPMMIEGIKPLVRYINNTTNTSIKRGQNTPVNIPSYFGPSPFMYSPPYAKALSELSEWGKDIPGVYSWY